MNRKLPHSLADVRGLRAARWIRESRKDQLQGSGPLDQRHEQDLAIEELGLLDTGIQWQVGESGWKKLDKHPDWQEMVARAGRDYDVLIVGYVSRFCRKLALGASMRDQLHEQGATIYFCDDRILLSDDRDWKKWADLLVGAEWYSRDLSHKMERTHATRFRAHADPAGMPPLGFRRVGPAKRTRLEIDPETIGQVVTIFERFALGTWSTERLAAESGLHVERIKPMLRNRIYNGWVQRRGEWAEAAWRSDPPVSDELWAQTTDVRAKRTRGGGPRRTDRVDLLAGLLFCVCGARVWSDGYGHTQRHRKRHRVPCEAWGGSERLYSETWELPIKAQVSQIDLSPKSIGRLAAAISSPPPRDEELPRKRIEAERRRLAQRYAEGKATDAEFLAESQRLRMTELAANVTDDSPITAEEAVTYLSGLRATLSGLRATWNDADESERADLVHAIYQRITVAGSEFVGVLPTQEAEAHGIALALPEVVNMGSISQVAMVGGEGLEPPTSSV